MISKLLVCKSRIVYIIKRPLLTVMSIILKLFKCKNCYVCPICGYYGWFININPETGKRKNSECPKCGLRERHRIQYLVFKKIAEGINTKEMSMLHFAPEEFFKMIFKNMFKIYITADLSVANVDRKEDLTKLSFNDNSFDFIYASHVLEHIKEDKKALSEIRRVLKPNGIAILPVPIIGKQTIEYPEPNPNECFHVRCPGEDYYERYKNFFSIVNLYRSVDFDKKYQLYVYENRNKWPATMSARPFILGEKHIDIVPVCFK